MKKIIVLLSVVLAWAVQAEFMALTDSFAVEIFDNDGTKTSTIALTGSGAADGTNMISATYGNFRGNGNELIVLRDTGYVEYYGDPLSAESSLARLGFDALQNGGRSLSAISTVIGGSNLVVTANPDLNSGTYGYEYDGSLAAGLLNRTVTADFGGAGRHLPYVSLVSGPDLHSAAGQDWACLGADGWVEIFADSVPGGAYERQSYFNALPTAKEIAVTANDKYVVLYGNNSVQFWSMDGIEIGSPISLDTTSTLVGMIFTGEATIDPYDAWTSSFGAIGTETNDFDGDGFDNLYEYASNGDPTDATDSGYPVSMQVVAADGTNWFEYVYARRTTADSGLSYTLMQNADLAGGSWTNTGEAVEAGAGTLNADFETVTNRIPMVGKTQEFVRHQIAK